jgi:RNA polymerase sigma factor (sigma-70 family)
MRSQDDTHQGGDRFPLTRHSAILALKGSDEPARKLALEVITKAYWRPVYKYIRVKWNRDTETAQDLTQGFFLNALEKEVFAAFDPAKARFRTFVRVCLDRYIMRQDEAAAREKRGGGAEHRALDFRGAEGELQTGGTPVPPDAEALFEAEWIRSIFTLAVDALRSHCSAHGKPLAFQLFERYDLAQLDADDKATYAQLAGELKITVETVTNHLAYARREFRRIVLDTLREMTASEEEFRSEVGALLGSTAV